MQLVAPDILADACGLSLGLVITAIVVGLALWLFGWSWHRFWIVLITTVLAGVYGLYDAEVFRSQPLLAATLLALAGGLLALALVRMLAFIAGGMVGLLIAQSAFPNFDPPICFLVSGLVSLYIFRLSMMAITSLAGAILIGYAVLSLISHYSTSDIVAWATGATVVMNWACGLLALLGLGLQLLIDRKRGKGGESKPKDSGSWDILLGRGVVWGFGKKLKKAG